MSDGSLGDDLELDVDRVETLGPSTVLHVRVGAGSATLLIEPPAGAKSPMGGALLTVASANDAVAMTEAMCAWLGVAMPAVNRTTFRRSIELGAAQLQGADDKSGSWQRTKLFFPSGDELFVTWERSGKGASFSEKDAATRRHLIAMLVAELFPDSVATHAKELPSLGSASDTVPLVTNLHRLPWQPVKVGGNVWEGDRFVFVERRGDQSVILRVTLDGYTEMLATISAPVRSLFRAGPHYVASVEYPFRSGQPREFWIVPAGQREGRRLWSSDENFNLSQSGQATGTSDGTRVAIEGRIDGESALRVFSSDGEILEDITGVWASDWPTARDRWRRYEVTAVPTGVFEIRDNKTGEVRELVPGRQSDRDLVTRFHATFTVQLLPDDLAIIHFGDALLVDCATLRTWCLLPNVQAYQLSHDLSYVACMPYDGGLLLGRIEDRWRAGGPATEDGMLVRRRIGDQMEGGRWTFEGTRTSIVLEPWSARFSLTPAEVARRLQLAGDRFVAPAYAAIDASFDESPTDTKAAAVRAASIGVEGASRAVWQAIDRVGAVDREALRQQLRSLARDAFVRTLGFDSNVELMLTRNER